jgi:hypothetical protein
MPFGRRTIVTALLVLDCQALKVDSRMSRGIWTHEGLS